MTAVFTDFNRKWLHNFFNKLSCTAYSALTLLVGRQEEHQAWKKWVMTDKVLVRLSVFSEV